MKLRKSGSHLKLYNTETKRTTVVPTNQGKVIPIGTLKTIEKQSGITFS